MMEKRMLLKDKIRDIWDDYHTSILSGIIGSFIGMAIAKLIGIL